MCWVRTFVGVGPFLVGSKKVVFGMRKVVKGSGGMAGAVSGSKWRAVGSGCSAPI